MILCAFVATKKFIELDIIALGPHLHQFWDVPRLEVVRVELDHMLGAQ